MFEDTTVQEEQFVVPHHPQLELKLSTQGKIKGKMLIVASYGPASLFCLSLISQIPPYSRINFLKSKQTSLADIYIQSQTIYIIFNNQVQKMKQVYFSQFVSSNFQFNKILILTHENIQNLQKISLSTLQYISTSNYQEQTHCNQYQQGIQGIVADLIVHAQINKVQACCFIGLFGDYQLNHDIINNVFGSLLGKQSLQQRRDITNQIKKYNMKKYSTNLYL